ncbi:cytochrome c1 [Sphingomonas canadensis]|uniref:Cytochrome c1 n=1 Tax=Sphingomonas canadensis TaxID=1219257 RepID=A0ABW3H4N2_9SPHN|nr:cytochrome c1 [Sphingomonas canadensis]MCW3836047.1 cytochrome c1 [Sphingomonas canadensis]
MTSLLMRSIKFLVGLGFVGVLLIALWGTISGLIREGTPQTAEQALHEHPKELHLPSNGPFGKFDLAQLQRGFKVYEKVCAQCHSLNLVSFRELAGLGYNEAEIKKIAKDWPVKQPVFDNKAGTWGERDNTPADRFPKVYYAANGTPPDLSLITKARHDGAAYVYSLMVGYTEKPDAEGAKKFPEALKSPEGLHFNKYFANLHLAMPAPLTDAQIDTVKYTDGTPTTVDQMAQDVSAFLVWTAEPTMQQRHRFGVAVLIFLIFATILGYGAYRNVWRGMKH